MVRNCSYCGGIGHNKATCEVRSLTCIFIASDETEKSRACSYCGSHGHDLRNCLAHKQLYQFILENETVSTPALNISVPRRPPHSKTPTHHDIDSVKRTIQFNTPLKLSDCDKPRSIRRSLPQTNRARQVTQVIDYNIYDEPWVWAPPKPIHNTSIIQPTPHNIIFT